MDTGRDGSNIRVLMLPFLAHGHISPFLELAKRLVKRNFTIYICSTPINLTSINKNIPENIHLVDLNLESSPQELPPHYHTTNGLPPHLMLTLKTAFENSSPSFQNIFESLKPDLLIYDFNQPWAADIALSNNIPAVQFLIVSAIFSSFVFHMLKREDPTQTFPFPISLHSHFSKALPRPSESSADTLKEKDRILKARERSCKIVLIKCFREVEGKYIDYLSVLAQKKMVPVGPLIQQVPDDKKANDDAGIIEWLDRKDESSVVFASFGSEYYLSKEEREEIAYGLELSEINFIWFVRFSAGESMKLEEALPSGFLDRVRERGVVVEGWAPQARILSHSSTGGYVSHCGWGSIFESLKFGVPVIAMPMQRDHPFNAKVLEELGASMEIVRDENGRFNREEIGRVIRNVVVEKSGEVVRRKSREASEMLAQKGGEDVDGAVEELVKLCKEKNDVEMGSFKTATNV